MKQMDKYFATLVALNLKTAEEIRPLTQSEKSLLENSEAAAGPMLGQALSYVNEIKKNGGIPQ